MYSTWILDHNCEVSCWLMKCFKIIFLKDFCSIKYGCQTLWPIHYLWTRWYPQGLGNIWVKFPLRSAKSFWRRRLKKVYCSKISTAAKACDLWCPRWKTFCSSWMDEHTCKFSPRSVQSFWRSFLKVFMLKKEGCRTTWSLTSSFFSRCNVAPDDPQSFHTDWIKCLTYVIMMS